MMRMEELLSSLTYLEYLEHGSICDSCVVQLAKLAEDLPANHWSLAPDGHERVSKFKLQFSLDEA